MKLLIGYDGSESADDAIVDLQHAGLPKNVEAIVLSVADLPLSAPKQDGNSTRQELSTTLKLVQSAGWIAAETMAQAREMSKKGDALVRSLFPDWTVEHESLADSPHRALVSMADHTSADLVLVGSQGRSALGHLFFGSVSQNVLSYARPSVRIGRRTLITTNDAVRLLLAFDGSQGSESAAQEIASRIWPAGSEVQVMTAINPQLAVAMAAGPLVMEHQFGNPEIEQIVEHRADSMVRKLAASGIVAKSRIVAGDAKTRLLEEARNWSANCIFMGAKGHSRFERFMLGTVSASVAARAGCSVEVVRSLPPDAAARATC